MSGRYTLSPRAELDLEEIWFYTFDNWSSEQADQYHAGFVSAFKKLASGQLKGRPAEIRNGYFKQAVKSHVIYFRKTSTALEIIRVLHGRMDAEKHLN